MQWTIALVLGVVWLLGLMTSFTAGGLIHVLLVAALAILVINVLQQVRLTAN